MKITRRQIKKIIQEMDREEQGWYSDQDETFADYKWRSDEEEAELDVEELGGIHDDFEEEEIKPLHHRDQRLAASPRRSGMGRRHEVAKRITKSSLKRIIREEMEVVLASPESIDPPDEEVGMAINQLQAISYTALELSELIKTLDYVPEWGDGKIAVVLDKLQSLRSYLIGKGMGRS